MRHISLRATKTDFARLKAINGFCGYGIIQTPRGHPMVFWLFGAPTENLKIACEMIQVAPRYEVGILTLAWHISRPDNVRIASLPSEWGELRKIEILEFAEEGYLENCETPDPIMVEAGIAFTSAEGAELIISAGALACSIGIQAPFVQEIFDPQYPVERCARVELE